MVYRFEDDATAVCTFNLSCHETRRGAWYLDVNHPRNIITPPDHQPWSSLRVLHQELRDCDGLAACQQPQHNTSRGE